MIEKKKLSIFEKKIGYNYKNINLLEDSLTHPSYFKANTDNSRISNQFERLEFLGDRVLGLTVAYLLFNNYNNSDEGDLSKKHSYLVQKKFLHKISLDLSLEKIIVYNYKKDNKKTIVSILSDSVESLIGSIYIDGGYRPSFNFIKKFWSPYLDIDVSKTLDPKTTLQEYSQQKSKKLPEYKLLKKEGPSHNPTFTITLKVLELKKITAKGTSIREAERKAAREALDILNEKNIKN